MTNEENLSRLQARQLELLALMGKSDAHAAKCAKLGVKFSDEYPDELKEYEAANAEYNDNETMLAQLQADFDAAQKAVITAIVQINHI